MTRTEALDLAVRRIKSSAFFRVVSRMNHAEAIASLESSPVAVPEIIAEFNRIMTQVPMVSVELFNLERSRSDDRQRRLNPVEVKILSTLAKGTLVRKSKQAAGFDLLACFPESHILLEPQQQLIVGSGIAMYIKNPNYVGLVVPRSGLGSKGIILGNTVGIIDADYQGEIFLTLWNRSTTTQIIHRGDRVAQLLFVRIAHPALKAVVEFSEVTERGEGGLGSTGVG